MQRGARDSFGAVDQKKLATACQVLTAGQLGADASCGAGNGRGLRDLVPAEGCIRQFWSSIEKLATACQFREVEKKARSTPKVVPGAAPAMERAGVGGLL